ncbi:MAG: hypothetical protein COA38_09265 [Fluviicola sp.]|nr:MAG: hypothetical protein COA38_09265 [Fluviicola sp.]
MKFTPSKQSVIAFSILLFIFSIVFPYIFDVKLFLGGDNCNYFILADGLANGSGYVSSNMPIPKPANHFPPGYPFFMSILMRFGISSIIAFKVVNGLLLLLTSFVFYRITRQLTNHQVLSIVLSVLVLLNAHILEYSTIMMSETSFMLFQLLSVYFLIRWHEQGYKVKSPYIIFFISTVICLIYIRTIGVTMLGASVLFILFSKKYLSSVLVLGIVLLALLPWQMRSTSLGGSSYVKSLFRVNPYDGKSKQMATGDWGNRMKMNSVRYVSKEIPSSIFPNLKITYRDSKTRELAPSSGNKWFLGILIILLTFLGIISSKKYRWLFLFIFGSNLLVYMLWPEVWFGIRFILPMVPLILLFSALGIIFILKKIFQRKEKLQTSPYLALSFGLLFIPQMKGIIKLHEKAEATHPKHWANYLAMSEWTKNNLKDAVISTRKPGVFYVGSGHSTLAFRSTHNREEFLNYLKENGVTHVVIENLGFSQTFKYLLPVVKHDTQQFKMIKSLGVINRKDAKGNPLPSPTAVWLFEYDPNFGYKGEYKNGLRNGKGVYTFRNGRKQTGTWRNDTLHGPGVFHDFNEKTFTGTWVKGQKKGKFIIEQPNSYKLETYWENDKPDRIGYLLDKNGNRTKKIQTH